MVEDNITPNGPIITTLKPAKSWAHGDEWIGTADELIAAGLVIRDQLPGALHSNKVSATYYCGKLVRKSSHHPNNENYLSISRYGKNRFKVWRGVSRKENLQRETRSRMNKKSSDINVSSISLPVFCIGEKVGVHSRDGFGIGKIVDVRYDYESENFPDGEAEQFPEGYYYNVEPSPTERFWWFHEALLSEYVPVLATVTALPSAAEAPIQQGRRRGRLPKIVKEITHAKWAREAREWKLKELKEKSELLQLQIHAHERDIGRSRTELIEIKNEIRKLTN